MEQIAQKACTLGGCVGGGGSSLDHAQKNIFWGEGLTKRTQGAPRQMK